MATINVATIGKTTASNILENQHIRECVNRVDEDVLSSLTKIT